MMLRFQPTEPAPSPLAAAFDAMDGRRIRYAFRKGSERVDPYTPGSEVDILLDPSDLRAAEAALITQGFRRLDAPGHRHHRFYLGFDGGRWLKIDAKIARGTGGVRGAAGRWRAAGHFLTALAQRRPLSIRRVGPVVALLGPDGAGKGTVIATLKARIPVGVTVIYLGERRRRSTPRERVTVARRVSLVRECAFVIHRALRFWAILLGGYLAAWSGHIVLCDRHPVEGLAIRPRTHPGAASLERFLFGRLMPWPDAVIVLDAPGELLFARKRENSPELLEAQRRRYRETFVPKGARLLSSTADLEATIREASAIVFTALKERRRW